MLGGNASSEIRMWVCGARNFDYRETGILEEMTLENFYRNKTLNYQVWDTVIYEKAFLQEGLTLLLNCTCQSFRSRKPSMNCTSFSVPSSPCT